MFCSHQNTLKMGDCNLGPTLLLPTGSPVANKSFTLQCGVYFLSRSRTDILSLTDSEEETIILAAESNEPLVVGTHSGHLT